MAAYYNEIEPYAADWLRNLIAKNLIAPGDVDTRSIVDVKPDDLAGYDQCHFFAGIGGWSLALRMAGWPDGKPVWTGSCPCQPFSAAGKGKAFNDPRHLWPAWFSLIAERHPPVVFGEQVAAAIGWGWIDLVHADLESHGYACGTAVLPACGVGAPHIRQRAWFVANRDSRGFGIDRGQARRQGGDADIGQSADGLADDHQPGRHRVTASRLHERREGEAGGESPQGGTDRTLGNNADGCGGHGSLADPESYGRQHKPSIPGSNGEMVESAQPQFGAGCDSYAHELADPQLSSPARHGEHGGGSASQEGIRGGLGNRGGDGTLADSADRRHGSIGNPAPGRGEPVGDRELGDSSTSGLSPRERGELPGAQQFDEGGATEQPGGSSWSGFDLAVANAERNGRWPDLEERGPQGREANWWADCEWLPCTDGKARPVEPGTFPLAHGVSARVGRLRAYGNAIVPQVAALFIRANMIEEA